MFLSQFRPVLPPYRILQDASSAKLVGLRLAINPDLDRSKLEKIVHRFGLSSGKIKSRGTEIADYTKEVADQRSAYSFFQEGKIPDLESRMKFYLHTTDRVFGEWYENEKYYPDHIVHVSCTGYTSPNSAQKLGGKWAKEKKTHLTVTNAYHMGCFAALPALRIARGLGGKRTDIVHNELCTMHFDPFAFEPEQIVVQSLFADGHIRYSLAANRPKLGFEIENLEEELIPDSSSEMTWIPSATHFKMHLSRDVPKKISEQLGTFVAQLLENSKHTSANPLIYAVHPGGPKIIEGVEEALGLSSDLTAESHEILAEHGNMSSATLPHIWDRIVKNPERENGATVISLAFGPGLTLSGGVFRLCRANSI